MTIRMRPWAAACILLAVAAAGCGKKGNPLPPLRPVPARVEDLQLVRTAGQVEIRFTVPAANADGSTPVVIDRVDVYAMPAPEPTAAESAAAATAAGATPTAVPGSAPGASTTDPATPQAAPAGAPAAQPAGMPSAEPVGTPSAQPDTASAAQPASPAPDPAAPAGRGRLGAAGGRLGGPPAPRVPSAAQIAGDEDHLRRTQPVRRPPPPDAPPSPATTIVPAPGDAVVIVDSTIEAEQAGVSSLYYVVVPVTGLGRGRQGPASVVANVPLGPLPAPPTDITLANDDTQVTVNWTASATGQSFMLHRLSAGVPAPGTPLSTDPVGTTSFSLPVEFGREVCVTVGAVQVAGSVRLAGAPSAPACLTPVDRYPPPVPVGIRVVQEGPAVMVIWNTVSASDLAGYVVLRTANGGVDLAPLFSGPVTGTTYRDATVEPGGTYTYAVYAVDSASPANASEASPRETLTVR